MSTPPLHMPRNPGPRLIVVDERSEAERAVAREILDLVQATPCVALGLATGETMRGVYAALAGHASFAGAHAFHLDEYLGLMPGGAGSFRRQMQERLFAHTDFAAERIHFPEVGGADEDIEGACAQYEARIRAAGGIELQLAGIGRNGHLAFNEPGASRTSRTRAVDLAPATREDARAEFARVGLEVPRRALTMGIATILEARRMRVLAFGESKAAIVAQALAGPIGPECPASWVREHADCVVWLDRSAAHRLEIAA